MKAWIDYSDIDTPLGPVPKAVVDLQRRVRLLEAVIDNFPGGLLLFDHADRLILCNEQQRRLLDYPDELFADGPPTLSKMFEFNARRGEYGKGSVASLVKARMALVGKRCEHIFERTRPNGTILEIRGVPLPEGGFVSTYLDVTEQRKNQKLVSHLAHHDQLTGLPNRVLFEQRLEQALNALSHGRAIALHYIDLDGFKPINDKFGHGVGDLVLKRIAEAMLSTVRSCDTVARIGGDEFVVIQTDFDTPKTGRMLASRLKQVIAETRYFVDQDIRVSASVGIACAPWDGQTIVELLRKADMAMYNSKNSGGDQYSFYSVPWDDEASPIEPLETADFLVEEGGNWDAAS